MTLIRFKKSRWNPDFFIKGHNDFTRALADCGGSAVIETQEIWDTMLNTSTGLVDHVSFSFSQSFQALQFVAWLGIHKNFYGDAWSDDIESVTEG
jgi:hypothetical protein